MTRRFAANLLAHLVRSPNPCGCGQLELPLLPHKRESGRQVTTATLFSPPNVSLQTLTRTWSEVYLSPVAHSRQLELLSFLVHQHLLPREQEGGCQDGGPRAAAARCIVCVTQQLGLDALLACSTNVNICVMLCCENMTGGFEDLRLLPAM